MVSHRKTTRGEEVRDKEKRRKEKRGIVLLIVLSLLALFALLVVTFVIAAGQFKATAESQARQRRFDDDPRRLTDMAIMTAIRDTRNKTPIQGHSLLYDLYGRDGVVGRVTAALQPAGAGTTEQQWLQIDFDVDSNDQPFARTLSDLNDYYGGAVFTLLEGPAKFQSTRILKYLPGPGTPPTTGTLYVDASAEGTGKLWPVTNNQVLRPRFMINGAPFNGTGHGYATATYDMEQTDAVFGLHTALLPNYAAYRDVAGQANPTEGGPDEGWDAADFQNMFLARVPADVATSPSAYIIPSFLRPELINYWMSQTSLWYPAPTGSNPNWQELRRMVIQRPMPWDHPNFTGGNKYLAGSSADFELHIRGMRRDPNDPSPPGSNPTLPCLVANYWDVDNDNDGIPDSIWIDVGLPARTSRDGKVFKPLVAFLIKDMDGRLNLNVHSHIELHDKRLDLIWQYNPGPDGRWGVAGVDDPNPIANGAVDDPAEAGAAGSDDVYNSAAAKPSGAGPFAERHYLARGYGIGPAEINLKAALSNTTNDPITGTNEYERILLDRNVDRDTSIGLPARLMPGRGGVNDELSAIHRHDWANDYQVGATRGGFGSHPDSRGIGATGVDSSGSPVVVHMGNLDEDKDDPYEVRLDAESLSANSRDDSLFTFTDLERILRINDLDSKESENRLPRMSDSLTRKARNLVTVHSSYIPAPRFAATPESLSNANVPTSARILDLYKAKLLANGVLAANVQAEIDEIVPFEFRRGQLLDINRPFGNNRDDNGNNIVDEPMEASTGENAWTDNAIPGTSRFRNVAFSHRNNDPCVTTWQQGTRQIYARHLYCLMMLVVSQSYNHPLLQSPAPPAPLPAQLTAKRIAQWAVNVIDFRDPDAIMTGFEVDLDPFNGWQVDGYLNTTGDGGAERAVVWGCESPELLIQENVAFHNKCIKDTIWDDGQDPSGNGGPEQKESYSADTTMYDREPDQFRKPEGSLFVELQSARSPFFVTPPSSGTGLPAQPYNPMFPPELYNIDNSNPQNPDIRLDLGRLSSADANGVRYPVWRLAIANPAPSAKSAAYPNPNAGVQTELGGATSIATSDGVLTVTEGSIERVIWFAPTNLGNASPWKNYLFYGRSGGLNAAGGATTQQSSNLGLYPGSYAVIGPRATTYVGLAELDGNSLTYENSPQYLDLQGGTFTTASTNCVNFASPHLTPLGIECAANPPPAWTIGGSIGMNVSEPLPESGTYYKEPITTANITNGYYDPTKPIVTNPALPVYNALPDVPFDGKAGSPLATSPTNPNGVETGTRIDFRSIYLQRLADPTMPWNPSPDDPVAGAMTDPNYPVNPYITVDWSTVDLTVFSGDENTDVDVDPGMTGTTTDMDPDDPNPYATDDDAPYPAGDPMQLEYNNSTPLEQFCTRSRGTGFVDGSGNVRVNPWTPNTLNPPTTAATLAGPPAGATMGSYFPFALTHTLGFLNATMGAPTTKGLHVGVPAVPTPWVTWNNRPFANPLELLLVPSSSPARMCYEFVTPRTSDPNAAAGTGDLTYSPFNPKPNNDPFDKAGGAQSFRAPFGSLLNFFHSSTAADDAGHFGRLLDFVETPSPFVGTETWYDPQFLTNAAEADFFRPPFNRLSRFRDPGRININTVFEQEVWEGITKSFPTWDPTLDSGAFWTALQNSRRGYTTYDQANVELNNSYPSRFANPFRSAVSSKLMPDVPGTGMAGNTDIQATLLRSDPTTASNPLFRFIHPAYSTPMMPSTLEQNLVSMREPNGSAYFRYQGLMRLGNMLSTTSNVYAAWVTVGYFELEAIPSGPNTAHPDGYLLGQELGADTGTVKRHRAFYIIDRSVPAAFEPGENHNVERTIMLRRYIE